MEVPGLSIYRTEWTGVKTNWHYRMDIYAASTLPLLSPTIVTYPKQAVSSMSYDWSIDDGFEMTTLPTLELEFKEQFLTDGMLSIFANPYKVSDSKCLSLFNSGLNKQYTESAVVNIDPIVMSNIVEVYIDRGDGFNCIFRGMQKIQNEIEFDIEAESVSVSFTNLGQVCLENFKTSYLESASGLVYGDENGILGVTNYYNYYAKNDLCDGSLKGSLYGNVVWWPAGSYPGYAIDTGWMKIAATMGFVKLTTFYKHVQIVLGFIESILTRQDPAKLIVDFAPASLNYTTYYKQRYKNYFGLRGDALPQDNIWVLAFLYDNAKAAQNPPIAGFMHQKNGIEEKYTTLWAFVSDNSKSELGKFWYVPKANDKGMSRYMLHSILPRTQSIKVVIQTTPTVVSRIISPSDSKTLRRNGNFDQRIWDVKISKTPYVGSQFSGSPTETHGDDESEFKVTIPCSVADKSIECPIVLNTASAADKYDGRGGFGSDERLAWNKCDKAVLNLSGDSGDYWSFTVWSVEAIRTYCLFYRDSTAPGMQQDYDRFFRVHSRCDYYLGNDISSTNFYTPPEFQIEASEGSSIVAPLAEQRTVNKALIAANVLKTMFTDTNQVSIKGSACLQAGEINANAQYDDVYACSVDHNESISKLNLFLCPAGGWFEVNCNEFAPTYHPNKFDGFPTQYLPIDSKVNFIDETVEFELLHYKGMN